MLQNLSQQMTSIYLIFSGAQQQQSAFKPAGFGATAQPAAISGLFESSTPVLGAATGVAPATSAFGQPQAEPDGTKPLFPLLRTTLKPAKHSSEFCHQSRYNGVSIEIPLRYV